VNAVASAAGDSPDELLICPACRALFKVQAARCPRDGAVLVLSAIDPMVGEMIGDRYVLESVIGDGGSGRVYRARHRRLSRRYAVKIPFGEVIADEHARRRIENEAEAVSRVQHPNLVGIVDVGETRSGLLYLAMDLVEGEPLATLIERGAIAPARALRLVAQLADGLAHAHERGLVHRDLKPDNIVVERDKRGEEIARVIDFGIALVQDDARGRLTRQGMVVGTPEYMAPEQLMGAAIGPAADLFALGMVLHELVLGVLPFEGTAIAVATRNLSEPVPPMARRVPGLFVDARIDTLVRWMTAKKPKARPGHAAEVAGCARALADALDEEARTAGAVAEVADEVPVVMPAPVPPVVPATVTVTVARPVAAPVRRKLLYGSAAVFVVIAGILFHAATRRTPEPHPAAALSQPAR
jgi:serine/threonine-protein kinase